MSQTADEAIVGVPRQARAHAADPRLRLEGYVVRPLILTPDEVYALPHEPYLGSLSCEEGGNLPPREWSGVRISDLIALADPDPAARYVRVSAGPYGFPIDLEDADRVLLCDRLGDQPMPVEAGGPWRLVVPGTGFFTSVKWVDRVEVTIEPPDDSATRIAHARARARGMRMSS